MQKKRIICSDNYFISNCVNRLREYYDIIPIRAITPFSKKDFDEAVEIAYIKYTEFKKLGLFKYIEKGKCLMEIKLYNMKRVENECILL